jgi:hypothetical protein
VSRARLPLPTDLVALIAHDGRVFPNEAYTWDRMSSGQGGPHPLETALEQWLSFATGKHTWVSVHGATIRGLISARKRAKRTAWEVDCLINADEDDSVAISLLERMIAGVGKQGAERAFLRVAADSPMVDIARGAGFFPVARETLYATDDAPPAEDPALPLRRGAKADAFGLYQLYQAATPANVRAIEGATFREWQAARETWGGRSRDLVLEDDGIITGWLRVRRGHEGRFSLLLHPERRDYASFIATAVARLGDGHPLVTVAPNSNAGLAAALEGSGFRPRGEFALLASRLARPARELAPESVGRAVTAG